LQPLCLDAFNWETLTFLITGCSHGVLTVQLCSWQRSVDWLFTTYLSGLAHHGKLQFIETLEPRHLVTFDALPDGEGRQLLVEDIALLTEIFCDLLSCPTVGLRGARIDNAMCPKWHIDRVPIRLLCTYEGPGTEWLDDQSVTRSALPELTDGACQSATLGDVVLLKGTLVTHARARRIIQRSALNFSRIEVAENFYF